MREIFWCQKAQNTWLQLNDQIYQIQMEEAQNGGLTNQKYMHLLALL